MRRCIQSLTVLVTSFLSLGLSAAEDINFGRDILPILSDKCFHCHGPDAKSRQADLRLDVKDEALRTEEPVIIGGKSAASELIRRITSADPDKIMPPPASKKTVSPQEVELLKRWIDQGAAWGKHWAFEAPQRPALPKVKNAAWIRNPLDAFILARLEKEGLQPASPAGKETLIRRVTLDLTGLPPTPAEVDAFVADQDTNAYEKIVDRLLLSPRYGERMVWEWLDAARYADTNGYQGDPTRAMWYWRDWAVNALNANMPYDQFTIEQLAGDLLPNPTDAQLIATGFHRNHMINGEGGRIAEESRVDYVQDRVETTAAVWMGLTFYCCRCHNHKYDPFTQKEYYQLSAYFNSIDESGGNDAGGLANPVLSFASSEQKHKLEELRKLEQIANQARDDREKELKEQLTAWEMSLTKENQTAEIAWQPLKPQSFKSAAAAELKALDDDSLLAAGTNPDKDEYEVVFAAKTGGLTGFRLEALPDDSLINKGPGRADNGNFVLNELSLQVGEEKPTLKFHSATFSQKGWEAAGAIDGKSESGWAVMPEFGKVHTLTVLPAKAVGTKDAELKLTLRLSFQFGRQHSLGRFRLLATTADLALLQKLPDDVQKILAKAADQRNDADKKRLAEYHRDNDGDYAARKKAADEGRKSRNDFEQALPRTMVMREKAQPRETFVLTRGVYTKPAEKVTHGVPTQLAPLAETAPTNRLALANWLMSAEHPLTARVTVNRQWQQFFGVGIVKTAEDFGVQGERPVHPELLDWLAAEFREATVSQPSVAHKDRPNTWNVKHIQRLIVTSAAYQQSSVTPPGMAERDPENRLLARGPRHRLPSWMIRDQALAASGLLVEKVGGPPVKGYQPTGVWEEATFGGIRYAPDKGEALYRRSVYQFWRRIVGPTVFFDVASRQTCSVKTSRTNTPLQALLTLNDVTYVEAARVLAERVLSDPQVAAEQRLDRLFRLVLCRPPKGEETTVLQQSLAQLLEQYQKDLPAAEKLLQIGDSPRKKELAAGELAAYTAVAGILLNLDETLNKE